MSEKIAFLAADTDSAQAALHELTEIYGQCDFKTADYIVALGGDGFMLQTLHLCQNLRAPVYGMNRGTVGFMMNAYEIKALPLRLANAEQQIINPLIMKATLVDGKVETALAINEVSLLRAGPQAAKLKILEPRIFPIIKLVSLLCLTASKEVTNSGKLVPKATTITEIT